MRPIFGSPVTASDVERLTSQEGDRAFVRLCATLVASAIGESLGDFAVPNWTERMSVPDKGVDTEYPAPLTMLEAGGLVGPGRNVYQVKWRRLGTRPARPVVRELQRTVTGALKDLLSRDGNLPDRYILLVNVDLSRADRAILSQALRKDCPEFNDRPLVIWGAAEIAAALNSHPHIRHAFFSEGVFSTLETASEELRARYEAVGWSDFVGYEEHVRAVKEFVTKPSGGLLVVTGLAYSGKTRTVIEALKDQEARVIWASDPSVVVEDHFRVLDTSSGRVLVVVDNCDVQQLEALQRWALSRTHLKTIMISRRSLSIPDVPLVKLERLSDQACEALFHKTGQKIPHLTRDWIGRLAGNNPGLLLYALAGQREMPERPVLASERQKPRQVIGTLLRRTLLASLRADELDALQVLAILPHVGIEEDRGAELATIAAVLGRDELNIRQAIPKLEERHLVVPRGRFVEVVPELIANELAAEVFKGAADRITRLWLMMDRAAQDRLLRRLQDLSDYPAVASLLDEVLSETGWFRTLEDLRDQARRFRLIAEARPRAALRTLQRLVGDLDVSNLQSLVEGDLRREIVWSLEGLALRAHTFSGAAKLLLCLAEAENENVSNSATGVFLSLFHWNQPEVSAPHSERIDFLQDAANHVSITKRMLVARAAGQAVAGQAVFWSHHGEGMSPPEEPARLRTWDDVWEFHASILGILRKLTRDQDQQVRATAFHETLESIREMLHVSILEDDLHPLAVSCFETLAELARMELSLRMRVELRTALDFIGEDLSRRVEETTREGRHHYGASAAKERLEQLRAQIQDESFGGRLKRWVGPHAWGDEYGDVEAASPEEIEPSSRHIIQLAKEATSEANLLTPELLDWLLTDEAQHPSWFFMALGEHDTAGMWQDPLVKRLIAANGPWAFGWYVNGITKRDRRRAEELLDSLDLTQGKHVQGILAAVFFLPASERSVQRLLSLFDRRLAPATEILGGIRYGGWVRNLSTELFEAIVNRIDDGTVEAAARLVEVLASWLYFSNPIGEKLQERAWLLLERSVHSEDRHFTHSWDRVATRLATGEPGRFYAMLERTAATPGGLKSAKTLAVLQDHAEVWKKLRTVDREGVLTTLLRFHQQRDKGAFWILWCLSHWVDPDTDAEILTGFASKNGEKAALAVADILDADKDGFWSIAETLIAAFPDSERMASRLDSRVGSTGVVQGSLVPIWKHRLGKATELVNHRHPKVAQWARQVVDWLEDYIRTEEKEDQERFIWDYRISRRQLEDLLKKQDSPDRLWAVRRILKRAPTKDVIELLTLEDIKEGLSTVDLPEEERKKWEAYLGHWSHRG